MRLSALLLSGAALAASLAPVALAEPTDADIIKDVASRADLTQSGTRRRNRLDFYSRHSPMKGSRSKQALRAFRPRSWRAMAQAGR